MRGGKPWRSGSDQVVSTARALAADQAYLAWRAARPRAGVSGDPRGGALTVRLQHLGVPLDAELTTGLPRDQIERLRLPRSAYWTPRLYAAYGTPVRGGLPVPEWLRPSPLEYIARVLGDSALVDPVARYLAARRFEFLDFDVV